MSVLWDNKQGQLARVGFLDHDADGLGLHTVTYSGQFEVMAGLRSSPENHAPILLFDFADITQPTFLSQTKMERDFSIPFVQSLENDHLLTVYKEAVSPHSLAAKILKISDSTTTLVHSHEIDVGGSYYDGRRYLYQDGKLVIPGNSSSSGSLSVFEIDPESGVSPLGSINHYDLDSARECYRRPSIVRSLIIDDSFITLSNFGAKLSKVTSPGETLATVKFQLGQDQ
jgi:hypothetical protein